MTTAHTPGPWELVTDDDPRGQPQGAYRSLVAFVSREPPLAIVANVERVDPAAWKANARLIASAPDLLRQRDALLAKLPRCSGNWIDERLEPCGSVATWETDVGVFRLACDAHCRNTLDGKDIVELPWAPEVREIEGGK